MTSEADRPAVPVKYPMPAPGRWCWWTWSDIPSTVHQGEVYLRRLRIFQTPWFSLYVHWIFEEDTDRDPHDHPWVFWSWVVKGGYVEEITGQFSSGLYYSEPPRVHRRWSLHKMPFDKAHKIVSVLPGTVSVIVTGRRRRSFRFWTPERQVPWDEYDRLSG